MKCNSRFRILALITLLAAGALASHPVAAQSTKDAPLNQTLVHDGMFFNVTKPGDADPILNVPAGVVLTDANVTFSVPENVPNSASLFISDGTKTFVYEIVNSTTFHAGIHLESGILSTGAGLTVQLSCYNISGNHCEGAMMWSGYIPTRTQGNR